MRRLFEGELPSWPHLLRPVGLFEWVYPMPRVRSGEHPRAEETLDWLPETSKPRYQHGDVIGDTPPGCDPLSPCILNQGVANAVEVLPPVLRHTSADLVDRDLLVVSARSSS
jgi:hypothetical protein